MRRLLIADVHASLPALEAVLADADQVDDIVFLGDLVGYGPHPAECVDLLRSVGTRAILGNHDLGVLAKPSRAADSPSSPGAIWRRWTWQQLDDAQRSYLLALPVSLTIDCLGRHTTVVHSSPSKKYLHPAMPDDALAAEFVDVPGDMLLFGHSHRVIDRTVSGRRYVCVKAVGQPRDGDPRAGYAVEEDGMLTHHVVAYDVDRVIRDLARVPLPAAFVTRWSAFLRTGHDREWSRE